MSDLGQAIDPCAGPPLAQMGKDIVPAIHWLSNNFFCVYCKAPLNGVHATAPDHAGWSIELSTHWLDAGTTTPHECFQVLAGSILSELRNTTPK